MSNQQDPKRIITGQVRLSYVHLLKPRVIQGSDPKYSVTLLIPKSDMRTINAIQSAMQAAIQEAIPTKWGGQKPAQPASPLYDGDGLRPSGEKFGDECKGHFVITATSMQKPEVVDDKCQIIMDSSQVYSGMYGKVSMRFFGYFNSGKKGIGCGLGNVMKLADGEPLSGFVSAEADFGAPAWAQPQQPAYPQQPVYQAPRQPTYPQQPVYQAPQQQPVQINPITGEPIGGIYGIK